MNPITLAYILIGVGVLLVVAELFVPTGFVLVVIGACCALVGVGLLFAHGSIETALMALLSLCVGGPLLGGFLFYLWPYSPMGRKLIKAAEQDNTVALMAAIVELEDLRGKVGRAVSSLRPSGVALFDGRRIDVITEGMMVEPGQWVKCVEVRANKVVVRPADAPTVDNFRTRIFRKISRNNKMANGVRVVLAPGYTPTGHCYHVGRVFAQGNQIDSQQVWIFVIAGIALLVFLFMLILFFSFVRLYIQALLTGAKIGIFDLIGMKLRNVDYAMVVRQKIALVQSGVRITTEDLESHFLSRGNVPKTATAVIAAHKAGLDLPWKTAAAIDLAGRDILDAVRTSVNPKVIDCPDASKGRAFLDAVCRNGIQLRCKARVTVRTKLERLVGGATEETIIARVGEGIVKAIGSADEHKVVLANPNLISQTVLHNSLDSQTAFEIVSIDIADIEVGENIGAKLSADQAAADLRVAQAEAEKRRAAAVAREQEMTAEVQENRAKVVLAEAEVPLAIAQAFKDGRLGVMDYYNLKNLQADTNMRSSIAGPNSEGQNNR